MLLKPVQNCQGLFLIISLPRHGRAWQMPIRRVDHINVVVSDLERAEKFFVALGFCRKDAATLQGEWISRVVGLKEVEACYVALALPGGGTNLELIQYSSPGYKGQEGVSDPNRLGFRHLAFEVENIEEVAAGLKERGVECLSEIEVFPKTGKKLVYFIGPDGILLELAEYSRR